MLAAMDVPRGSAPHRLQLRVRYGETDQMGVVHHANYALYVEESRTTLMRERGCSYAELERRGVGLPVRKLEVRYRNPAHYEDVLVVTTAITRLGAASVAFESEITRPHDEVRIASVLVELACIDLTNRARGPIPLPDDLRQMLTGT
jgi:acyl-CoA thioester hydrolase